MEYKDFINKIKKVNEPRTHKITNSYGVYDYYKYYRKTKPNEERFTLSDSEFYSIYRDINEVIINKLLQEGIIKLPCYMGEIMLEKFDVKPKLDKNGNVIYNAPINWGETLKLWHEDEEAYEEKLTIKNNISYAYKILYKKVRAKYRNKSFYNIQFNRNLRKRINEEDKKGNVNIIYNNKKSVLV